LKKKKPVGKIGQVSSVGAHDVDATRQTVVFWFGRSRQNDRGAL
jgi:hypothetical protein